MGKFDGLSVKKGSLATTVPVRIGINNSKDPDKTTGGVRQGDFDAVHVEQMNTARRTLEKLGFRKFEWVDDEHWPGRDMEWFKKRAAEKVRLCRDIKHEKKKS